MRSTPKTPGMRDRMNNANKFLKLIGDTDRCFYSSDQDKMDEGRPVTSEHVRRYTHWRMEQGKLILYDARGYDAATKTWPGKDIPIRSIDDYWKLQNGGTCVNLLQSLHDYIRSGQQLGMIFRYSGYTFEGLKAIHALGKELGIMKRASCVLHVYGDHTRGIPSKDEIYEDPSPAPMEDIAAKVAQRCKEERRPMTGQELTQAYDDAANNLSNETRQSILDMIRKSNTLGDVARYHNVELMVVCAVLNQNIISAEMLRTTDVKSA